MFSDYSHIYSSPFLPWNMVYCLKYYVIFSHRYINQSCYTLHVLFYTEVENVHCLWYPYLLVKIGQLD